RLDIAALMIVAIPRKLLAGDYGLAAASENGDAVPRLLPTPGSAIARLLDRRPRELVVRRFQLLKRNDVAPGLFEPLHKVGERLIEVVDVEGGSLHRGNRRTVLPAAPAPPAILVASAGIDLRRLPSPLRDYARDCLQERVSRRIQRNFAHELPPHGRAEILVA